MQVQAHEATIAIPLGETPTHSAERPAPRRADSASVVAGAIPAQRSPGDGDMKWYGAATVLLIDPDRATRDALQVNLIQLGIGRVLGVASAEALQQLAEAGIVGDLALVNLRTGLDASQVIGTLRASGWVRILAMAPTADIGAVSDAIGAGVDGVLIGRRGAVPAAVVPGSIHALSRREIDVIALVADGRSNKRIGQELNLSSATVKSHLARIGRKVGTGDRARLVALALRGGVIH